ncbi:alpha/beta hydrolase [Ovoidimarina sediminis]|uniref:alpha/beta hydrolase n=1 Tax=Ovoidimarina sediminis TaxID=3079856 RepID=UPI00290AB819|nr:alpha/beta hydrolase [Rhodophyticola sp. MJ-SS7]MDU8943708.1 alpha/beta hydrolase [Rhodophyticola sp. MJ-SS7]
MPSLRCTVVNLVARHVLRAQLARTPGPAEARRDFNLFTRLLPCPSGVEMRPHPLGLSFAPPEPRASGTILYFHGGGYICGAPQTHRALAGCLARATGRQVITARYRLAPEHPAPAAFDDALCAFDAMEEMGTDPTEIILGGDSAGGGLALALLARLCADGRRPRALFAFSPWTDLTASGDSITANAARDRILPADRLEDLVSFVTGDGPRDDPRVSPHFASFDAPPPVMMQVARTEILYDDTRRMAEKLRAAGGDVTVTEVEDAIHVWPLLGNRLPEGRRSFEDVAAFLDTLPA